MMKRNILAVVIPRLLQPVGNAAEIYNKNAATNWTSMEKMVMSNV